MMRKIYSMILFMVCVFFIGCTDDDNTGKEEQLKIISSEVSFDCGGGTGVIHVESALPVSATSSEDWCRVEVDAGTVHVTVSPNLLIGSRTAMVTVVAGSDETRVPVYQLGDVFDTDIKSADFTAAGGEVTFRVKSNWEVEFEMSNDSWLACTYSASEEQVTIKALPLEEKGKYRAETVKVKSGTHEITVTFTQVNMTGKFMCYRNQGKSGYGTCLIEDTDTDFLYKITPEGSVYDAPYYARYRKGQLVIFFGQYLGQYQDESQPYLYLCAYDKAGRLTWGSSIEYVAPVSTINEKGDMILVFTDNGTWSGQHVDGFYYGLFNNLLEDGGSTTGAGIASVVDLIWLKVSD